MGKLPLAYIIEDQSTLALLYSDALALVGYQVKTIRTGHDAINQLETASDMPDLIVLDINLPGLTGDSILAHLRRKDSLKHIPVMVVTANSLMARKIQPQLTERDNLVIKPLAMPQLQAFARQVLPVEEALISPEDATTHSSEMDGNV